MAAGGAGGRGSASCFAAGRPPRRIRARGRRGGRLRAHDVETLVIANPSAGDAEHLPALAAAVARLPGRARLVETEEAGHAEVLARRAARAGVRRIVAAGGDGTLNEVLNGIADHFERVALGILPVGTGNDFVRSVGIPADLDEAVEVLIRGRRHRVDVASARVEGRRRWFLNMSAGGFSREVDELLDAELKSRWGPLSYIRSAAGALPELTAHHATIEVEGEDGERERLEVDAYMVVVANARYVASGIPAAPAARLDDGLLDLIVFPEMPLGKLVALVPRALLGRHVEGGAVVFRRGRWLRVEAEPAIGFNADGEVLPAGVTEFEVRARV
ncbi:MAG TPA: diacylglycerol kinase family protein, partial [Thermoanaerobaculia bacterium]